MKLFQLTKREYSNQDREIWKSFYDHQMLLLESWLEPTIFTGIKKLFLADEPPCLLELSHKLEKDTGRGLVDAHKGISFEDWYSAMRQKKFPISTYFNDTLTGEYTAMADFIHEVVGHLPSLYNKDLSDLYMLFANLYDTNDASLKKEIIKINWHTIEYGFINGKVLGAVFLGSANEFNLVRDGKITLQEGNIPTILGLEFKPFNITEKAFTYPSIQEMCMLVKNHFTNY